MAIIKKKRDNIIYHIAYICTTWMEHEGIVLSEISQAEKDKTVTVSLISSIF